MDKHQRCVAEGCQAKEAKGYQDCEQHSGCCAILPTEKHPDRLILDLRQAAEMIGFATSMVERQAHRQAADEAAAKLQERFRSSAAPEGALKTGFIAIGYIDHDGGVQWEPNKGPGDLNPGQLVYVSHLPK